MRLAPTMKLNTGHLAPQIGLGVWRVADAIAAATVQTALSAGYRSIDTAAIYQNEVGVGTGIKGAGVPRKELFITTKVWNDDHGYDSTLRALDTSLQRLKLDYLDLYLIHWPVPDLGKFVDTYRAMMAARDKGLVRSIGVSNFNVEHLEALMEATGEVPAVNQVELHPHFSQPRLRAFHAQHGIITESWSPLAQGKLLDHPTLQVVAKKHNKSPAQVVLRWHIELGLMVIPKSVTPERIRDNLALFDFSLDSEDMKVVTALDTNSRVGPDPLKFPAAG
jgi:2,5-diketo-D-gluconate reductase A